jgi:signal transduction histidine kinase
VVGDPAELREVLTNLIFNAVHAMPEGGTITISTERRGGHVILEVSDTGMGMSEEVRRAAWSHSTRRRRERDGARAWPWFTGIAQRHGAMMDLESEVGRGTTFRFPLPLPQRGLAQRAVRGGSSGTRPAQDPRRR